MQPLPEKIKQLEVEIGGALRGQLLKHSAYEFGYTDSAADDQFRRAWNRMDGESEAEFESRVYSECRPSAMLFSEHPRPSWRPAFAKKRPV